MQISIVNDRLIINEKEIIFPSNIHELEGLLGAARKTKKQYNVIYTWDEHGILGYSKNGQAVEGVTMEMVNDRFDFSPKHLFSSSFMINGVDYHIVKKKPLRKASKYREGGSITFGNLDVYFDIDDDKVINICITEYIPPAPKVYSDKYKYQPIAGEKIQFTDFNFKLAVVQQLMYEKKVLEPMFNLYEFVENYPAREIDIERAGYDLIPEVTAYFQQLEVDKKYAADITEIIQEGGDDIYGQLLRFWDGEDDTFNIQNFEDVKHFPNLRSMQLFYADNLEEIKRELAGKNITVEEI